MYSLKFIILNMEPNQYKSPKIATQNKKSTRKENDSR